MAEPNLTPGALTDEEMQTLIDYARQRFAEERWPMSPVLRPVREIMEKPARTSGCGLGRGPRAADL